MSSIGGPNNIRDGLVLFVDAANSKCFRGEPTTNNANQSITVGGSQVSFSSVDVIGPEGKTITASKVTINSASGVVRMRMYNIINVVPVLDQYYTISCWIKRNNNVNITGGWESELSNDPVYGYARPGIEIGYTGVYNAHPNTQTIPSEWTRVVYTFKYAVQPTVLLANFFYFSGLGGEVLFYGFQFEEKAYETPFVIGTRGTTVATGGGTIDLSNNENNGIVTSGITYNSSNYGGLSFDGVNDSITIPYNSNTMDFSQAQTICMWIKPITGADSLRRNPYNQAYGGSGTITHEPNGTINYYFGTNGGNANPYVGRNSSFTVEPNELAFITVTRSQALDLCNWYKNGALSVSSTAGGYSATTNSTADILIADGYTNNFLGDIYYAAIYNTFKTGDEVLQIYNATKSRFGL